MQAGNFPVTEWLSASIISVVGDGSRSGNDDGSNCGHRTFKDCDSCGSPCSADAGSGGGLRLPGSLGAFMCWQQGADADSAGAVGEPPALKPRRGVADGGSSARRKSGCYVAAVAALRHPTAPPSPRTPAPSLLPTVRLSSQPPTVTASPPPPVASLPLPSPITPPHPLRDAG